MRLLLDSMKQTLTEILLEALARAKSKGELKLDTQPSITLETPKDKNHGDMSSTFALAMAKIEGKPPRKIAEIVLANLQDEEGIIAKTEIAGPGFINFFLKQDRWRKTLFDIDGQAHEYGL